MFSHILHLTSSIPSGLLGLDKQCADAVAVDVEGPAVSVSADQLHCEAGGITIFSVQRPADAAGRAGHL